jgi:hypothetical protein
MLRRIARQPFSLSDLPLPLSDHRIKFGILGLTLAAFILVVANSSEANTWKTTFQPNPLGAINIYVFQFQERYIDDNGEEQYRPVWSYTWPDEQT